MTYQIFKRTQAARDIEEAFVYIAEDNFDVGISFLASIEDSIDRLAEFPLVGTARNYKNPLFQNMRMWQVKGFPNYLIFYLVLENHIEVIRVLHSSRDIGNMFNMER